MNKLKYLLFLLLLILFPLNVKAGTGAWADKIVWSDSTTSTGTDIYIWGVNYTQHLSTNNIVWFSPANQPYGLTARIVVYDPYLFTGSIVKASLYILTNYPLTTGKIGYYSDTTYDAKNDFLTITKVADDVRFLGNSGTGSVYKFTYSFKVQDCLDSEFDGRYICYADDYSRTIFLGDNLPYTYAMQIYSWGDVTFSDLQFSQPDLDIYGNEIKTAQELSVWETIKALPGKLLNWFTDLPGKLWTAISTGFDWIVDGLSDVGGFIVDLPSNIWNGLKTGFDWIVDGLSSLGTFILNGIKDLFIPSDLSVNSLVDAFQDKLGFIYDVPATVISYGLNLSNISFSEMNTISLPTITIFGHNFWNSQDINITEAINTFKPFRYLTSVACVSLCVNALFKYKDKIFGGGGNYN